jgi:hypothetical protein
MEKTPPEKKRRLEQRSLFKTAQKNRRKTRDPFGKQAQLVFAGAPCVNTELRGCDRSPATVHSGTMSKHRKFNSEKFLRGFQDHEDELHALFAAHHISAPDVLDAASFYATLTRRTSEEIEPLLACLHELNDLSSKEGREILEQTCASMEVPPPEEEMCHPRAACWLYLNQREVFEHAMELMAVRGIQANNVAIFPGRAPLPISDAEAVVTKIEPLLLAALQEKKKTDKLEVRHYLDGDTFVCLVFCERQAEVLLEFGTESRRVASRIRRPADQHILLYHQSTGVLEIEGARAKDRAILRNAFAKAAFDDETFFPESEDAPLLHLDQLLHSDFNLPVQSYHRARITGLKVASIEGGRKLVFDCSLGRSDLVAALERRGVLNGMRAGASVESVRIELILDATRAGRKSITLKGANSIQFNRASYADIVYNYLHSWGLMMHEVASPSLV